MYLDSSPDRVLWVYHHLDHPTVTRDDAPSPGAWNMLGWAREARTRFYTMTFPKALAAQAEQELAETREFYEEMGPLWMVEHFQARLRLYDRQAVADASPELRAEVRAMVDSWGKCPDDESAEILALHLTAVLMDITEASAKNPDASAHAPATNN